MVTTVIYCPHKGCSGYMYRVKGGETEWMLQCSTCQEFYYKVGSVTCIRCCMPRSIEAADALLEFPHGQNLKREIADRLNDLRRRVGLGSFGQPGQDDDEG